MFDTVTGATKHLPHHRAMPIVMTSAAQALAIATAVVIPMLFVTDRIPDVPTMMAFVAAPPPPPPPPPPAAPPARKPEAPTRPAPASAFTAPLEEPQAIEADVRTDDEGPVEGVPGGVEGGIPGGVIGGVVGGMLEIAPPPPPPARRTPVRVGGQIQAPALVHRVEPIYPALAVSAHVQGIVILEAVVDEDGQVAEVKVIRAANALLDRAATDAVRQWRYSPLLLNGHRARFVLTVVLTFHLDEAGNVSRLDEPMAPSAAGKPTKQLSSPAA